MGGDVCRTSAFPTSAETIEEVGAGGKVYREEGNGRWVGGEWTENNSSRPSASMPEFASLHYPNPANNCLSLGEGGCPNSHRKLATIYTSMPP